MKSERRESKAGRCRPERAARRARASPEESNALKIALYRREAEARKGRTLSLWYLPMAGNALLFALLAAAALLGISDPLLARLLAGACAYAALAGAALTAVGVRRGNLKAELSVRMRRKGAEA